MKTRQPTVQEIINSLITVLVAYKLLLYAKQQSKEIFADGKIPEVLKGWLIMALIVPIGYAIASDPLLSQTKDKVYETLTQMVSPSKGNKK